MLKGTKKKVRDDSGVGVKPISIFGSKRLVRAAIRYAIDNGRKTVTLVHKGNIQKFTEGAFREWGYEVATEEFRDRIVTERESWILGNLEAHPGLSVEDNAALIEPGIEFAPRSSATPSSRKFRRRLLLSARPTAQASGSRRSWSTTVSPTPSSSRSSSARPTTACSPPPTSTATTSRTPRPPR